MRKGDRQVSERNNKQYAQNTQQGRDRVLEKAKTRTLYLRYVDV